MSPWNIEQDAAGRSTIKHSAAPRFTAEWTSGEADLSANEGLFWQDEASGSGEDCITLHSFQWLDKAPDQATFNRLMQHAALFIDDWIAKRF
jgi:hypothetical protein